MVFKFLACFQGGYVKAILANNNDDPLGIKDLNVPCIGNSKIHKIFILI